MSKYKNNKLINGILIGLAVVAVGGVAVGLTHSNAVGGLFDKIHDDRKNLVVLDLKSDVKGKALTADETLSLFNNSIKKGETKVFKTCDLAENIYLDNGGLRFGSSTKVGNINLTFKDDYKFNRVKIIGQNYSVYNEATGFYSCDTSSIQINDAEKQAFTTNEEKPTKQAPTDEKEFYFGTLQNTLNLSVSGKRAIVYGIELWLEEKGTNNIIISDNKPTSSTTTTSSVQPTTQSSQQTSNS